MLTLRLVIISPATIISSIILLSLFKRKNTYKFYELSSFRNDNLLVCDNLWQNKKILPRLSHAVPLCRGCKAITRASLPRPSAFLITGLTMWELLTTM